MPDKVVEIPGVGNIAFPESMSDADIATAAAKIHSEKQGAFGLSAEGAGEKATVSAAEPNTLGTAASHFAATVNPVQAGQLLPFPKALGGSGLDNPLLPSNIVKAMSDVKKEGDTRWDKGDHVGAFAKYAEALIPVLGPMMSHQGNQLESGQYAAAGGDLAGVLTNLVVPKVLSNLSQRTIGTPALTPQNAAEAEAVQFGQSRGIPIDAATATSNRAVKGVQFLADRSLGGSLVAEKARAGQAAQLARVGDELATEAHPVPVTPEQAGAGIQSSVKGLIRDLSGQADEAYGRLRAIEAQSPGEIPKPLTAPEIAFDKALKSRMKASLGYEPSDAELHELRRIQAEMDNIRYVKKTWTEVPKKSGNAGDYDITPGAAGAPVYTDILSEMPGTSRPTRGSVLVSINQALKSGQFTNAAKGALEVARKRVSGGTGITGPSLPASAGDLPPRPTASMLMPVDLTDTKTALKPIYDRLKREAELVPLQGDKGRALVALDRLLAGPDHAPVSVVDAALGDLKSMARGAVMPELRSQGQGLAAQAVKTLDAAVMEAVKRAGPDAVSALQEGRSATIGKYAAAEVLDSIRDEPVAAYRQATAPKDAGIGHLRQLQEMAPGELPKIGRAALEELLQTATQEGGFQKARTVLSSWQRLGPQTKALLYGPELTKNIDRFFLLAERINDNPNPSGTGAIVAQSAALGAAPIPMLLTQFGAAGVAKMLHSPMAVKLLTKGVSLQVGPARFSQTARLMGSANIAAAARVAGVPALIPAAAEQDPAATK